MALRRFLRKVFSTTSGGSPSGERRYDDVQITNAADGTTIRGHEAVKAYLDREEQLHETYGSSLIFEVYRANVQAGTLADFQGPMLAEIRVDGSFVTGDDTVVAVKAKLRSRLESQAEGLPEGGGAHALALEPADRVTLFFGGRPMQDITKFYADNFVMLPAWVQVLVHRCELDEVARAIARLQAASRAASSREGDGLSA